MPRINVRPIRVHIPDADQYCDTIRGIGFRACSSDGWKGPHRRTYAAARADAHAHKVEQEAALEREAVSTSGEREV